MSWAPPVKALRSQVLHIKKKQLENKRRKIAKYKIRVRSSKIRYFIKGPLMLISDVSRALNEVDNVAFVTFYQT